MKKMTMRTLPALMLVAFSGTSFAAGFALLRQALAEAGRIVGTPGEAVAGAVDRADAAEERNAD